jgi:hypothetical protein
MKMKIKVIVHEAEEGDFWVEVPATPGAVLVLQLDLDDLPRRLRADLGDDIGERQRASLLERAFGKVVIVIVGACATHRGEDQAGSNQQNLHCVGSAHGLCTVRRSP